MAKICSTAAAAHPQALILSAVMCAIASASRGTGVAGLLGSAALAGGKRDDNDAAGSVMPHSQDGLSSDTSFNKSVNFAAIGVHEPAINNGMSIDSSIPIPSQRICKTMQRRNATQLASSPVPKGCRKVGDSFLECGHTAFGQGVCGMDSYDNLMSAVGAAQGAGMLMTDVIAQCTTGFGPVVPSGSSDFLNHRPTGFDSSFPNLHVMDKRGLYVVDDFLSPKEVEWFRDFIAARKSNDLFFSGVKPYHQPFTCAFTKGSQQSLGDHYTTDFKFFADRVTQLTGKPPEALNQLTEHTLRPGGFVSRHYDAQACEKDHSLNNFGENIKERQEGCKDPGRNQVTLLLYLSDVPEGDGGNLHFPNLNIKIQPKRGRVAMFFPSDLDGHTNPWMLHESQDLKVGERQMLQMWLKRGPT